MVVWARRVSGLAVVCLLGCGLTPMVPPGHDGGGMGWWLETMPLSTWTEDEPTFAGVTPRQAARAWEKNLRGHGLKATFNRTALSVDARTSQGERFSLVFWPDPDNTARGALTRGRLVWDDPNQADKGWVHLIDVDSAKKRGAKK